MNVVGVAMSPNFISIHKAKKKRKIRYPSSHLLQIKSIYYSFSCEHHLKDKVLDMGDYIQDNIVLDVITHIENLIF